MYEQVQQYYKEIQQDMEGLNLENNELKKNLEHLKLRQSPERKVDRKLSAINLQTFASKEV